MDLDALIPKIAATVAAACILGGGTIVLNTATEVAVIKKEQSIAEKRLEKMDSKLDRIIERLPNDKKSE